MGLFDFFNKSKKQSTQLVYAPTQTGWQPIFTDFGSNIYASDIVVQSIRCKANEFKKLEPRHIIDAGGKKDVVLDSSVAKLLRKPNEYMSMADFLEKIAILLELNKNVYIYPTYYDTKGGRRVYTGLYPLKPRDVWYLVDKSGRYYIKFRFANNSEVTLPQSEVIHWRKDYGLNDYFGGSAFGRNDDEGLLFLLNQYDKLLQSLSKTLEVSCQINGVMNIDTYHNDEAMEAEKEKFREHIKNNESGILFTDAAGKYTPITRDLKMIDAPTLEALYKMILRANGTSLAILDGDYTPTQKQAYYEHALEADIKSLGQAMSAVLFTEREASFGNKITLYPQDIFFWSVEQKNAYMAIAVPAGAMKKNEIREMGGLPPVEGGDELPRAYNSLDNADEDKPQEDNANEN